MRQRPVEDASGRERGGKEQAAKNNRAPVRAFPPAPTAREESGEGWQLVSGKTASSKGPPTHMEVRRDTN
eukprot:6843123-Heterocapsa_arctica.AAC.1